MTPITNIVRRYAARIVAIILILALYGLARLPELSHAERARLAAGFSFVQRRYQSCRASRHDPSALSIPV